MKRAAKPKTVLVPDNRGRLDVLVKGVLTRLVQQSGNPVAQQLLQAYGNEAEGLIDHLFAPRTKNGRIKKVPMIRVPDNDGGRAA